MQTHIHIHIQTPQSVLYTVENYFPLDYANELFSKSKNLDLIVEPEMRMGTAHRCMGFYSNESEGYYFSGQLMKSKPLSSNLEIFMQVINTSLNTKFNGLLVNYYRDGSDNLGAHSDAEKDLYNGKVVG